MTITIHFTEIESVYLCEAIECDDTQPDDRMDFTYHRGGGVATLTAPVDAVAQLLPSAEFTLDFIADLYKTGGIGLAFGIDCGVEDCRRRQAMTCKHRKVFLDAAQSVVRKLRRAI